MHLKKSLRFTIPTLFVVIIIPSALFLAIYSFNLNRQVSTQIAENSSSVLRAVKIGLYEEMAWFENYLADISTNNDVFRRLGGETDPTQSYLMAYEVSQVLSSLINTNSDISCLFVCNLPNDVYHAVYGDLSGNDSSERTYLKSQIRAVMLNALKNSELASNQWYVVSVEESYFLCRIIRSRNVYCGCLLDISILAEQLAQRYELNGQLLFSMDNVPLNQSSYNLEGYMWTGVTDGFRIINTFPSLLIVEDSMDNIMNLAYLMPYQGMILNLNALQLLLLFLSVLVFALIPVAYLYLYKSFIRPMNELVRSMEQIQSGDLDTQPSEKYSSEEFRQVNDTFNSMIAKITHLRIEAYEKRIESERAQLTSLKLQIRPHFYLNCLKNIYALAAMNRMGDVQNSILYLSNHLRYVFTEFGDEVTLKDELELCRNYIALSGIGKQYPPQLRLDIGSGLMKFMIPPVSILTILENSIKHVKLLDTPVDILVSAHILTTEECSLVNITVRDNGQGFSDESLKMMNGGNLKQVGLNNLIKRLKYLYGDDCMVTFSNISGAQVDLFIPIMRGGTDDSSVNRGRPTECS